MARVQPQFDQFHGAIKLGRYDENQTLREKRDIIRDKLEEKLPKVFEAHDEICPTFWFRDQGSYEMDTGVKPLNGDYDIDQGLYFGLSTSVYSDPVVLKQRVHEALDGHTKSVTIRRSCVTVQYQRQGEPLYHVDVAIYSDGAQNADSKSRLAKGKENSLPENRVWEVSSPRKLSETIFGRFAGNDRAQFRRVVRYLKRWKDQNFSSSGNAAPPGIALTVATYHDLAATYEDIAAGKPDDLGALRTLVRAMLGRFMWVWDNDEGKLVERLQVVRPTEPNDDLLARLTANQMSDFKTKLTALRDALDAAANVVDPVDACTRLQGVFGSDFPVPQKQEIAKVHAPAIISSSNSA